MTTLSPASPTTGSPCSRYDGVTITFHWLTAFLVIALFASALTWDELAKGTPLRKGLQSLHISMGILLAATVVVRIVWRFLHRHDLPPSTTGLQHLAAKIVHLALYVLLVAQVTLGFLFRWAQNEPFYFFGLFEIPRLIDLDHSLAGTFAVRHYYVAWTIIILAGCHAVVALAHHYVLKDRVLARMLPMKPR
jgi:cytochrome b561